jgi:uridine kinase
MLKPYIIGITGGSGSGKTTFINRIREQYTEDEVCVFSQDNYYKPREEQFIDENEEKNFDLPESFERERFHSDMLKLSNGEDLTIKEYTFNNSLVEPRMLTFKAAPILIVEGIFIFHFREVAKLMNLKLYIDVKEHLKLIRRIKRDRIERNYPLEDVLYRYEKHVFPSYESYIAPFIDDVDLIINNNKTMENSLAVINGFLNNYLKK